MSVWLSSDLRNLEGVSQCKTGRPDREKMIHFGVVFLLLVTHLSIATYVNSEKKIAWSILRIWLVSAELKLRWNRPGPLILILRLYLLILYDKIQNKIVFNIEILHLSILSSKKLLYVIFASILVSILHIYIQYTFTKYLNDLHRCRLLHITVQKIFTVLASIQIQN